MRGPARILVVDDEAHLADGIAENLQAEGYETVVAYDGRSGLAQIREQRFALVVLDVMMPCMDGLALCAQLRREGIQTPVLFLTVKGSSEDRIRGFAARIRYCIDSDSVENSLGPRSMGRVWSRDRAGTARIAGP